MTGKMGVRQGKETRMEVRNRVGRGREGKREKSKWEVKKRGKKRKGG